MDSDGLKKFAKESSDNIICVLEEIRSERLGKTKALNRNLRLGLNCIVLRVTLKKLMGHLSSHCK